MTQLLPGHRAVVSAAHLAALCLPNVIFSRGASAVWVAASGQTSAARIGRLEDHGSLTEVTSSSDDAPPAAGPYLQTVSGRWVNPFDPDPAQLDAGDIARALANQCRFGGHSRVFYSVAQHCVIVSRVVEDRGGDVEDAFAALMHDAGEAYLGDMPHPLKHRSALGAAFRHAEARLEEAIRDRFKIKADVPGLKTVDRALLATERRAFSAELWHWPELEDVQPLGLELSAWSPDTAAEQFIKRYGELEARR